MLSESGHSVSLSLRNHLFIATVNDLIYSNILYITEAYSLHCLLSESFQVENIHPKGVIQILTLDVLTKKFSLIFFCLFFLCFIKCLSIITKAKSTHNVFLIIIKIIIFLIIIIIIMILIM